jgi:hypothetical protein
VNFLKRLFGLGASPAQKPEGNSYLLTVRCHRCGEVIQTRINLNDDLSIDYAEDGSTAGYFCRKVLMGKQSCFRPIEVRLTFDAQRRLTDRQISGGDFVEG